MPQELHAPHVLDCTGEELDAVISNTHTHDNKADLDAIGTAALRDVGTEIGNVVLVEDVANALEDKVDKVPGKGLSTEDYTTAEKNKLAGIEAGANKYVHPATHPASMITELPTSLPADGGTADKVKYKLTAGSKTFDGSAAVTITAADISLTEGDTVQSRITQINGSINAFGSAAARNVGTDVGDVPAVGSDGLLPAAIMPPSVTVENVLTSTSTINALSAAQGKILADQIGDIGTILDDINGEVV